MSPAVDENLGAAPLRARTRRFAQRSGGEALGAASTWPARTCSMSRCRGGQSSRRATSTAPHGAPWPPHGGPAVSIGDPPAVHRPSPELRPSEAVLVSVADRCGRGLSGRAAGRGSPAAPPRGRVFRRERDRQGQQPTGRPSAPGVLRVWLGRRHGGRADVSRSEFRGRGRGRLRSPPRRRRAASTVRLRPMLGWLALAPDGARALVVGTLDSVPVAAGGDAVVRIVVTDPNRPRRRGCTGRAPRSGRGHMGWASGPHRGRRVAAPSYGGGRDRRPVGTR
jgi:hypothetical protein